MSGPVVPFLEVTEVDGSPSGRPITKLVVSNGDLSISGTTATIDTTGAGGTATLSQSQIGFGSASDLLTGSANFTFVDETGGAGPTVTLTGDKPIIVIQDDTSATDFYSEFTQSGASLELRSKNSAGANIEIFRTRADSITFNDDNANMETIIKKKLSITSTETADDSIMLHLDTDTFDGTMLLVESGKAHNSGVADDGPNIELYRSATGANGKYIGSFLVTGLNAADEKKEWFKIQNYISDSSTNEDSLVIFKALNNGVDDDFMRLRGGAGVIINDNGRATLDFRVQTSSSDYGLFVDSGESGVSINGNYDTTIKSEPKLQILSQTGVASYAYLASSGSSPESLTNDELQGPIYAHISASAHTYVLPTGVKGMQFHFFSNDGNISIEPQATDKINGGSSGATSTFSTNHQIYTCICYNANEWVVSPPT